MKTNTGRLIVERFAFLALVCVSGCAYTTAGTKLPPITPPAPSLQRSVEYTVGDFSFTLEGGKMVTSKFMGRLLSQGIMEGWKDRGYIRDAEYVESGAFSGQADYRATLSGTQYNESSIAMQVLSGLTLFLLPYTVTQHYDIQYTVEDPKTGRAYSAGVQELNKSYVELFLLFALPISTHNQAELMRCMGDHLYEQLRRQGAFQPGAGPAPSP